MDMVVTVHAVHTYHKFAQAPCLSERFGDLLLQLVPSEGQYAVVVLLPET